MFLMIRNSRKIFLLLLRVAIFSSIIAISAFASSNVVQAAGKTIPSQTSAPNCSVLQVQLHGSQPATTTCLQTGKVVKQAGILQPLTYTSACSNAALELTYDNNAGGYTLCFLGSGFANMTDYCGPAPFCWSSPWNDQASYFSAGCSDGYFYTDINGNGASQHFGAHVSANFLYGAIPNDTLSSLQLLNSCTNG